MDLARRDLIGLDGVRPAAKNARMSRTKALATSGDSSMGLAGHQLVPRSVDRNLTSPLVGGVRAASVPIFAQFAMK